MNKISYLIFAAFIFIIDQLSKWGVSEYVIRPLHEGAGAPIGFIAWYQNTPARLPFASLEVLPFFNLVMVWNQGVSFGLFSNGSDVGPYILSAVSALVAIGFLIWLFKADTRLQRVAIAMVIAGALGNVVDRLRFGAVVDFLDFHALGYHYPAFNIADSGIVVGVFLLIVHAFLFDNAPKNARTEASVLNEDKT